MVLKFYASSRASNGSGLVALVLMEKQIPFEHVLVDLSKGEHKAPSYLAMHPFGQIPLIVRASLFSAACVSIQGRTMTASCCTRAVQSHGI
jgi:glutathione S-transferase